MTKLEIIEETINYYKTNPRGSNPKGGYAYKTESGAMCAVGRCMNDKANFDFWTGIIVYEAFLLPGLSIDEHLKPEYHGHSTFFWDKLQNLHDSTFYWIATDTGFELSESGKEYVEKLKELYKDNNS